MTATVAIVGGGYAGITVAQALDDHVDVVLIDPKDSFVHNVAALRALVDPAWHDRLFLPYDRLLRHGRVVQSTVVAAGPTGVHLTSGETITADYVVLATGSGYPYPAKMTANHAVAGRSRLRQTSAELERSRRVLLLGAGPVGLELAGEIRSRWPDKAVTIVDPEREILSGGFVAGFDPRVAAELRGSLRRQLTDLGVELVLGTSVRSQLPPAAQYGLFSCQTWSGRSLTADIWFRCFGRQPVSGVLSRDLSYSRMRDGRLKVEPDLRLATQRRVFALGDVAASGGLDSAVVAMEQGELVAANIRALLAGGPTRRYRCEQPLFLIPLGPRGGASYSPTDGVLDADVTAEYKGRDLFWPKYAGMFGLPV